MNPHLETLVRQHEEDYRRQYAPDPFDAVCADELRGMVESVLHTLSEKHRYVLSERFGISGGPAKTLSEIGRELRLSRERVRAIEAKALGILRHPARGRWLKPFHDPTCLVLAARRRTQREIERARFLKERLEQEQREEEQRREHRRQRLRQNKMNRVQKILDQIWAKGHIAKHERIALLERARQARNKEVFELLTKEDCERQRLQVQAEYVEMRRCFDARREAGVDPSMLDWKKLSVLIWTLESYGVALSMLHHLDAEARR